MTKKELAQKRNYFKFVLMGSYRNIDLAALTEVERQMWKEIDNLRTKLLSEFDERSKEKGLSVKNKCWCGKRRKTKCGEQHCKEDLSNIPW